MIVQKEPFRVVFRKRYFENMQQIYRRTSMPKCDFTLRHGCFPVTLLLIFRTPFSKNNPGWLLLHSWHFFKNYMSKVNKILRVPKQPSRGVLKKRCSENIL